MRIIFLLTIVIITSCSSGFNSNQAKYEQLILSERNSVMNFDTSYFEQNARSFLISGTLLQQQKDFAGSILEFQEALKYDSSAAIEYAIAKSYLELQKVENAKEHLFISTELNPNFVQSIDLLTEIYLYQNNLEKAEITNRRAIELENSTDRMLTKALILEFRDPDKSLEIYNSIRAPQYQNLINERKIVLYKKLNKTESLVEELKLEQKKEPFNTQISREIFQIYLEENKLNDAVEYLSIIDTLYFGDEQETYYILMTSALIQERPIDTLLANKFLNRIQGTLLYNTELLYYTGLLASNIGNDEKRDVFFTKVLKIGERNSDFRVGVAEAYYFDQEYDRSLNVLKELNPDSLTQKLYYYTLVGMNKFMQKDYYSAIDNYNIVLEVDSSYNNYTTLTMIGEVYDLMGNTDSALYYYELHYSKDENNTYLLNNYAYTLSKVGRNLEKALDMSAKTLEKSPNNSAFLDTYGWIYFKMGKFEKAKEYIEKAIEIGGVSAEVYEHLGDIYIELGRNDEAKEMYKKSLELEKDRFKLEEKVKI